MILHFSILYLFS